MAEREDEELQRALQMSLQHAAPEPKRIKPRESVGVSDGPPGESPEARSRREILAAAAERRMVKCNQLGQNVEKNAQKNVAPPVNRRIQVGSSGEKSMGDGVGVSNLGSGEELLVEEAHQLYSMVFGSDVSRDVLAQWCNQGIRFSSDPETCMGLVQHEGGPCGVLAAIQAFLLKKLLFSPESADITANKPPQHAGPRRSSQSVFATFHNSASLARALVLTMGEVLFSCGSRKSAVIATLSVLSHQPEDGPEGGQKDEMIAKALEGLSIESGSDLQKVLRVNTYTSQATVLHHLKAMLPIFQSRMGAMLFLISALLSRGLESIQADRDDPSLPLVTAPFGHASQEIVNLLLCGQAVPNVLDGRMDLGGGMVLKGIPTNVEVGFLTLLESLNFCKVGQNLKCPKWPIWVVGSESHYTVLFALDTSVQDENELEQRESQIRKSFDAHDQSGGGGFISSDGLHIVLRQTNINLPPEKLESLCSTGFIVWSEFWQVLLELDKSLGGLKDSTGLMGKKQFDLYHFNGIAKSVSNGSQATTGGESPQQRPRLSKLKVLVPPKWTPEEFMADVGASSSNDQSVKNGIGEVKQPEPSQQAPLVDCIRTRWPRAICSWVGDPPSIV